MKLSELRDALGKINHSVWDDAEIVLVKDDGTRVPVSLAFHSTAEITGWPESPACKMRNYEVQVMADPSDTTEALEARRAAMSDRLGPPVAITPPASPAGWEKC